ncbi:hypothetical protein RND71_040910 [Anisodus tanguticus]|uniref:Uncharacterized protein n=1 Tax=Anisodus tanguticus TaxID=243964 RepID=A0AAE1QTR1_9SOLA|nr:hypothetical protein RND71_040910 [Anisodus tanguticus]
MKIKEDSYLSEPPPALTIAAALSAQTFGGLDDQSIAFFKGPIQGAGNQKLNKKILTAIYSYHPPLYPSPNQKVIAAGCCILLLRVRLVGDEFIRVDPVAAYRSSQIYKKNTMDMLKNESEKKCSSNKRNVIFTVGFMRIFVASGSIEIIVQQRRGDLSPPTISPFAAQLSSTRNNSRHISLPRSERRGAHGHNDVREITYSQLRGA